MYEYLSCGLKIDRDLSASIHLAHRTDKVI